MDLKNSPDKNNEIIIGETLLGDDLKYVVSKGSHQGTKVIAISCARKSSSESQWSFTHGVVLPEYAASEIAAFLKAACKAE